MASAAVYDFRVVIDVSGSMKKTDPQNLRVPALKLINGLIPSGSRAGVWIFGKYVDMAVKWGEVNDSWRQRADLGADKIHSNALLTNIESALARARVGWDKPDPGRKRILLLLTDGKVDVSKDPAKNEKSRNQVLTASLQALKKAAETTGARDRRIVRRRQGSRTGFAPAQEDAGGAAGRQRDRYQRLTGQSRRDGRLRNNRARCRRAT
jgi:hypothetical protein